MILNDEQKQELKQLKNMPGWKVLLDIEKEANDELYRRLATFDIDNEQDRTTIKVWQQYSRARNDFFQNTEKHIREVYQNKIQGVDY